MRNVVGIQLLKCNKFLKVRAYLLRREFLLIAKSKEIELYYPNIRQRSRVGERETWESSFGAVVSSTLEIVGKQVFHDVPQLSDEIAQLTAPKIIENIHHGPIAVLYR